MFLESFSKSKVLTSSYYLPRAPLLGYVNNVTLSLSSFCFSYFFAFLLFCFFAFLHFYIFISSFASFIFSLQEEGGPSTATCRRRDDAKVQPHLHQPWSSFPTFVHLLIYTVAGFKQSYFRSDMTSHAVPCPSLPHDIWRAAVGFHPYCFSTRPPTNAHGE